MSTLQIKNLHVQVATNDGPKPILKGVDLTIDSNQVHAISHRGQAFRALAPVLAELLNQ